MGIVAPLLAGAGALFGTGGLAAGAGAATAAASTATAGSLIGGAAASLAPAALGGLALASQPKFPKPPAPPNPAQFLSPKAVPSLFSPGGDSSNSTFFGSNRAPQIAGGKKVLLGE